MKSYDIYMQRPEEMTAYLSKHGWHFSKKALKYATSKMSGKDGRPVNAMTYEEVEELMKRAGISLKNDNGYDKAWVAAMCKADYWGSAIEDETHLAKFVKDYLDDPDGSDEKAMRHWYCDMVAMGVSVPWEELI